MRLQTSYLPNLEASVALYMQPDEHSMREQDMIHCDYILETNDRAER